MFMYEAKIIAITLPIKSVSKKLDSVSRSSVVKWLKSASATLGYLGRPSVDLHTFSERHTVNNLNKMRLLILLASLSIGVIAEDLRE